MDVVSCGACGDVSLVDEYLTDLDGDVVCPSCGGAGDAFPMDRLLVFDWEDPDVWPYNLDRKERDDA